MISTEKIDTSKNQVLILTINTLGGSVGGYVNFIYLQHNASLYASVILGAFASLVASNIVAVKVSKLLKLEANILFFLSIALGVGFSFNPFLSKVTSFFTLQSQLISLQNQQQITEFQQIETLKSITEAESPAERKAIAIDHLNTIAEKTTNDDNASEAINVAEETAENSNNQIRLETIKEWETIALETDNQEKIDEIITSLQQFTDRDDNSQSVVDEAEQAISNINEKQRFTQ